MYMNHNRILAFLSFGTVALLVSQLACSDKSNDTSDNRAPSTPILIQPLDGTAASPTSVQLAWEASDPDGDSLTFDLFVDTSNPPTKLAATELPGKSHTILPLSQGVTYFWRVTATDPEGLTSPLSSVSSFSVGSFAFAWRDRHPIPTLRLSPASVVSGDQLLVFGGISLLGFL